MSTAIAKKGEGKKSEKLTDLPNIGKRTAAKVEKSGIWTAEDFLKRDPYEVTLPRGIQGESV